MIDKIPKQLQNEKFGFCLVLKEKKAAFEMEWQKNPYKFDDEKLLNHLKVGGNYGVIAGVGNLRILDIDDKKLIEKFDKIFKDTLIVETVSGNRHYYFFSDYDENHVLANDAGEYRAKNWMVVGPGCEVKNVKKI